MQKTLSILLVLLATSTAAQAFEVVGSEARLGFSTLTGFEVGQTSASFSGEAHIALGKQGGNTMQLMGIGGRYSVSDKFGLGASLQRADLDNDADVTRLGIKADMALGQTATAFVELGNLAGGIDGSGGSEGFVGIGADFKFGAKHGTTFGKRGLFDMLPGL